jgi:2-desacetyl-2-hydroxyethyl bacteriochlorophyllide A dehydrogenase
VRRVGVCGTDFHAWYGRQPFFTFPRILGHELAGEVVEAVDTTVVRPGDRCAIEPYLDCGACRACRMGRGNCCERLQVLGVHVDGGMRDLIEVPVRKLHPSRRLDLDALALVEPISVGAHAVRRAAIAASDTVLVIGAGPIGLATAMTARAAGAHVSLLDANPARLDFARHVMGFERVARSSGDHIEAVRQLYPDELPPIVIDATGHAASMEAAFRLVAHGGRLVFVGLVQSQVSFDDPDFHRRELTVLASRNALPEDFRAVIEDMEAGRVDAHPWITHRAALEELPARFPSWTDPANGVVKAIAEL